MLKQYGQVFRSAMMALDAIVVAAVWALAYPVRFSLGYPPVSGPVPFLEDHMRLVFVVAPCVIIVLHMMGLYEPMRTDRPAREFRGLFKAVAAGMVLAVVLLFFIEREFAYSRLLLVQAWLMSVVALWLYRAALRALLRRVRKRGLNQRRALIVGGGRLALDVAERISAHPEFGIALKGVLVERQPGPEDPMLPLPVLGLYGDLDEVLVREEIDILYFALPAGNESLLREMMAGIPAHAVTVQVAMDLAGFPRLRASVHEIDGLPIVSLVEGPLIGWASVIKRAFDLVVGTLSLLVALPFLALVALLVKLTSPGPILYRQERMGLDGRKFMIFKFRTMRVDAEAESGPVWAVSGDGRRTPVGALLRRTSLDELPQLFNVLRGEMSMVGPRPERPVFVDEFKSRVPGYMLRHKTKAGITGLAQVRGLRGNTPLDKRIECDIYYIEHWSLWLDIKILLLTIPAVFKGDGAY